MTTWVIISWVFVAIFTGVNAFVFIKLKKASESMMKMAFPGAKDMNQAMSQMQQMMGGKMPSQQQMKQAMDMMNKMQNKGPRR